MDERNKYREMIVARKEKERVLLDLLSADKVDFTALENAIEEAREQLVREEVLEKAAKQLEFLKYCKEVEGELQTALTDKNGDAMKSLVDKIEAEGLVIDAKMLNDAKGTLAKMK